MSRREFPARIKVEAFKRSGGNCEACGCHLTIGRYAYDHINPDGLTGAPTLENCAVLCSGCHTVKTATDVENIARAKRREARHLGAKAPSRQALPCGRKSKFKKKMNGEVVLR